MTDHKLEALRTIQRRIAALREERKEINRQQLDLEDIIAQAIDDAPVKAAPPLRTECPPHLRPTVCALSEGMALTSIEELRDEELKLAFDLLSEYHALWADARAALLSRMDAAR